MKLIFASHNPNKVEEIKAMLPKGIEVLSLDDIGFYDDIEETSNTIEGNAIIKVEAIYTKYQIACFADDTGLEVDALGGEPGVKSARYAGNAKDSQANVEKLLTHLAHHQNRKAQFKTVIAYKTTAGQLKTYEGICTGEITESLAGDGGFGYDPIFKPSSHQQTFAQMNPKLKQDISHRGIAFKKFIAQLKY